MKDERRYYSVREYAQARGIAEKTVYKLIEGEAGFPHLRYGRKIIIDRLEADQWARQRAEPEGVNG